MAAGRGGSTSQIRPRGPNIADGPCKRVACQEGDSTSFLLDWTHSNSSLRFLRPDRHKIQELHSILPSPWAASRSPLAADTLEVPSPSSPDSPPRLTFPSTYINRCNCPSSGRGDRITHATPPNNSKNTKFCAVLVDSYKCRHVNGRLLADRACASPNLGAPSWENQADALFYFLQPINFSLRSPARRCQPRSSTR